MTILNSISTNDRSAALDDSHFLTASYIIFRLKRASELLLNKRAVDYDSENAGSVSYVELMSGKSLLSVTIDLFTVTSHFLGCVLVTLNDTLYNVPPFFIRVHFINARFESGNRLLVCLYAIGKNYD